MTEPQRSYAALDATGKLPPAVVTIPAGLIYLWAGPISKIPDGWHICDGTDGTPDLRDLFPKLKTKPPVCIVKL